MTERMRAFVALPVSAPVKERLRGAQAELQRALPGGALRYTQPDQFHLTLVFLGNITTWQATAVEELLARIAPASAPFDLVTAGLGIFPSARRPSVIWLGLSGDLDALHELQGRIQAGLSKLDLAEPHGDFHPHLTLARIKGVPAGVRTTLAELLARESRSARTSWTAGSVQLVQSHLEPQGARYRVLADLPLGAQSR